jgi:hypothetical protein
MVFMFERDMVGDIEDAMVLFFGVGKDQLQVGMHFLVEADGQHALAFPEGHITVEQLAGTQFVDFPNELPGMMVDDLAAFFKLIEFFENRNGNNNVMFLEIIDTGAVVEDDIGVEDKEFFLLEYGVHG